MPASITFPGKDANGNPLSNPFQEQLDFFRQKLNLPTERYDDIIKSAHDRAFIVAGAAHADLLNDLNAAIRTSIQDGRGLEAFRKEFDSIVKKHGWTGWTGEGSAAGQAWRTNIIYQTNMATSYAAGRWKQLTDPALLSIRPYWRYVHADGIMRPRPLHVSWHGLVLRHDHAFWLTHFPPNGWLCHCRVTSASPAEYAAAQAAGLGEPPAGWDALDPKTGAPVGIDKGFDYAPGANVTQPLSQMIDAKLIKLDAPVGAAMYDSMRPTLKAEREAAFNKFVVDVLASPTAQGLSTVLGALNLGTLEQLAALRSIFPATAAVTLQDGVLLGAHARNLLAAGDWQLLPQLLDQPGRILINAAGQVVLVGESSAQGTGSAELVVLILDTQESRSSATGNPIVSAFKMLESEILLWIESGLIEVLL
ncbi:MAG: phage head morphogenesis protein [Pseudomonadota bacterium]|nr:phage head morphogenesis protein [Pseudomonadota bacterium]